MSINAKKIIAVTLAALFLTGCAASNNSTTSPSQESSQSSVTSYSRDIFAMDTYMTVTCYGERAEEACGAAEAEIKRLDSLLSVGSADSEISILNSTGSGALSSDSNLMVEKALEIYGSTGGTFDITIYPVMELWGFTTHEYNVPDEASLSEVLSLVGSDKLTYEDGTLTLAAGQGIDLGGIAKGYTSDRLMEIFEEYDLNSGLISLGGNVQLYGAKPDGSLWKCGIRDPHESASAQDVYGVLQAEDCAVITSGAYERYFTDDDGNVYHHIIDPATGYPAASGLISATIVSESGVLADALSTAVYVMGLNAASEFWRSHSSDFDMILMTEDDEVYITEGLEGSFSTDYKVHVIK